MIYRVSYDVGLKTPPQDGREVDAVEVEEFSTAYEAFGRAREHSKTATTVGFRSETAPAAYCVACSCG